MVQHHSDKKKVWLRIKRGDRTITLSDVTAKIEEIQAKHPELDVFFDGDEFAICSRPARISEQNKKQMTLANT